MLFIAQLEADKLAGILPGPADPEPDENRPAGSDPADPDHDLRAPAEIG